jgi:hypothetical protein
MHKSFPQRVKSQRLEELSFRFFQQALPKGWTTEKHFYDYGVDLSVDIFDGERATGLELLVQLKASAESSGNETETVSLKTSTYNLLRDKLQVVMIVKYVHADNDAYWMLLRDVPTPTQQTKTFTIHVPKANRLSVIPWENIHAHIRRVTRTKLAAMRRLDLERRKQWKESGSRLSSESFDEQAIRHFRRRKN